MANYTVQNIFDDNLTNTSDNWGLSRISRRINDSGVTSVVVDTGGIGYTSDPEVSFSEIVPVEATAHSLLTGTSVSSVIVNNQGVGYTSIPTITFLGGGASSQATCNFPTVGASSSSISFGGFGYTQNDVGIVLTIVGGTGTSSRIVIAEVNHGSGVGPITLVAVTSVGSYSAIPSNPVSATGPTLGSGATFTLTYKLLTCPISFGGIGYSSLPIVAISVSGSTSPATATAILSPTTVSSVVVDTPGAGYTSVPDVIFSGGGASVEATGHVPATLPYPYSSHSSYVQNGENVDIYILDTGVDYNNTEFTGRIRFLFDFYGGSGLDLNGHGTSAASVSAGTTHGVAKQANIVIVKVYNDSGMATTTAINTGIAKIITDHQNKISSHSQVPSIINMSYATIDSTVLSSIQTAIQNGIVVISAGGNNYQNLSNNGLVSNPPQGTVVVAAPELIVVAASNILDNPWIVTPTPGTNNGTNYGSYIDIWSPGQDIWTAGIFNGSSFPPIKVSGSDFAAAHVSGVMALFLGGAGIGINSSYVQSAKNQLILNSTTDIIVFNTNISFAGTPNRLLFNSLDGNYSITDAVLNSSGSQYSEQPNSRFLRKSPGTTT